MLQVLERESTIPLYQQLEQILKTKIGLGEWQPNERIPSENELNRIFGLSRMTVRGVLTKLVAEGLLIRVAGKGTYVTPPVKISARSPAYKGVREQLEALGYATTTSLISLNKIEPTADVKEHLQLAIREKVFEVVRLRSVDKLPISLHRSYIPAKLAPDLPKCDVVGEQLCVILEKVYQLRMKKVQEHLEAVAANAVDAKYLGMRHGSPALFLQDIIFTANNIAFEYSTIVFRGDKMKLRFDFDM